MGLAAKLIRDQKHLSDLLASSISLEGLVDPVISGVQTDSRKVGRGDLFFAYPGINTDSRQFVDQIIQLGAAAVLVEKSEGWQRPLLKQGVSIIPITGLRNQISQISGKFYDYPSTRLTVTGVTGTNGKTSVSQFIAALLNMNKRRCGVIGTLGYGLLQTRPEVLSDTGFTTPDAVALQACFAELYAQGADSVAMEVSSHSLDQHRIDGIDVDIAIFTNLSHDHLDYHGNFADYARAKQRLFELPSVKHKVINIDDEVGRTIALNIPDAISYSLKDPAARIFAQQIKYHEHGFAVSLKTPWGEGETLVPLLGEFNLSNCLAVIAALGSQGIALGDILSSLPKLSPVPGRMQIFPTASDEPSVLIDYAHTPDALKNALLALRAHCKGQLWCVFGCGGDRDMAKRPTMGFEAGKYADIVVVTSDNPRSENPQRIIRDILGGIIDQSDTVIEENRAAAISLVIAQAQPEDVVLIAGKGHETYQEIAGQKNHFNDYEQIALAFSRRRQEGLSL